MDKFTIHQGLVAPMDRENVDTDQIMPKQFLRRIDKSGLAEGLLYDLRFDTRGAIKPDFVLHRPQYAQAKLLLGGSNFGCGSSREHAPWALQQYGFRAILAPSFADIFFNNCFKNGLLPIQLPESVIAKLFDEVAAFPGYRLTIDLPRQVVVKGDGSEIPFEVQAFRKYCLINGFDDIGLTLRHAEKIRAYEAERLARMPWLDQRMVG